MDEMLAAAAGQILGTSFSPEIPIAVIVTVRQGRTLALLLIWSLITAVAVIALRIGLIGINSSTQNMILATLCAVPLWSLIAFPFRRLYASK